MISFFFQKTDHDNVLKTTNSEQPCLDIVGLYEFFVRRLTSECDCSNAFSFRDMTFLMSFLF